MALKTKLKFDYYYKKLGLIESPEGKLIFESKQAKYQCLLYFIYATYRFALLVIGIVYGVKSVAEALP